MRAAHVFLASVAMGASALHAQSDPNRIRDLDPRDNDTLKRPKGNLDFVLGADAILSMGGDLPGHRGYGGSFGVYVLPENSAPDTWRTLWGGEFTVFSTDAQRDAGNGTTDENITGAMVLFEYGVARDLGSKWEFGAMVGLGSGFFYGTVDDASGTEHKGNWDWVLQIKPTISYKVSPSARIFAGYRLAYMAPFYDTELVGSETTKITYSAVELGVTWRF